MTGGTKLGNEVTPHCPQLTELFLSPGMQVLVDSLAHTGDRVRSPHMNNEEPIELAIFPDAKKPQKKQVPPIGEFAGDRLR